ncbi:peptidyl-prolyl cis-trans isomerase (rotamase) [Cenarchaeum symbiosum A]|uniref:peptidylprolyl isomerase n=1 Tax=Cenarchaeum symbiosum (strain A) TaxID=414004 RepID=A0RYN7_CENSY|nr:peptidyl-prolyl cis-trans isomerase (rotamase) [Cenarchaeum symbiosum A]
MKALLSAIAAVILAAGAADAYAEDRLVVLHTKSGDIAIEFFADDAPGHVENYISLVESGFYDRTVFHRVIEGFMIQGGDPKTKPDGYDSVGEWGTGDPGYMIDAEFNTIKHNRGILSMARSQNPDSAGSQFFIVHRASNFLDGQYTAFGRVVTQEGLDTLDVIATLETPPGETIPLRWGEGEITSAEVVDRSSVDNLLDLGEPERMNLPPEMSDPPLEIVSGTYTNDDLGIEFDAPDGWSVQSPAKTTASAPDMIFVGPQVEGFNPAIAITIDPRGSMSLDDKVAQNQRLLDEQDGPVGFEVLSENTTDINEFEAFAKDARGTFPLSGENVTITFREVVLATPDLFYTLTYSSRDSAFNDYLGEFNSLLYSFTVLPGARAQTPLQLGGQEAPLDAAEGGMSDDATSEGGGCLIATAAYGTELAPQVQQLREVRDGTLMSTASGSAFMSAFNSAYYAFSPAVADLERESPAVREAVRLLITPMLATLSLMSLAEEGSEQQVLGLGIAVISLNLGMYVAAPALAVSGLATIRRRPRLGRAAPQQSSS